MGGALEQMHFKATAVDGSRVDFGINSAWSSRSLQLRTIDLKSAYRQLAVSLKDLPLSMAGFHSR
eukprot:4166039-Amphidinium_carterae.1